MPRIENKITIGNVLIIAQLLLMIWAAAVAYTTLTQAVAQAAEEVQDHEARLRFLEGKVSEQLSRIDERLKRMEGGK